jgi:hypothetical protein
VRPIGKGKVAVEASVGGPMTKVFGAYIPLPLSTVGATYGAGERTDVHAAYHPTAAAVAGVAAVEVGAGHELVAWQGARPRVMADATVLGAGGDASSAGPEGGFALFLQPTVTASWDWGKEKRQSFYTGLTGFSQVVPTPHLLGAWVLGNRFAVKRTSITTEFKWIAPYASSEPIVPEFVSPGYQGAVSFQVGLGYTLGGAK